MAASRVRGRPRRWHRSLLPAFALTTLTEVLILGLFALSLDLLVGYTGLDSFGHAGVYGLGAYSASLLAAAHRAAAAVRAC